MNSLYKILVLIFLSIAGFMIVPVVIHLTIWANILDSSNVPENFLKDLIQKSSFVWMGSIVLGVVSLFIQARGRLSLLLCPLVLPPLFTLLYIITQS